MSLRRSILFYPALSPERWEEAMSSGADMVVFDLEDGTVPERRVEARSVVMPLYGLKHGPDHPARLLRVNHPRSEDGLRDILAVIEADVPPHGLILPKIEHGQEVSWVADLLRPTHPDIELIVLIESPAGLEHATEIATATRGIDGPQVTCLFFGTADFSASIGSDLGWDALAFGRGQIVAAANEAGIDAMDGVWFDPSDDEGLREEARRVAAMGFTGKASYDASQIPIIHEIFSPTDDDVAWAERVIKVAGDDALGTARLDGKMVNESIVRRARRILARR
ncbi:MAG: CoA ester lyase [Hyphomicrobiaceae bacterium]|nr:CoA ester lyase [Hyphomicrobiaceae bacterium]